MSGNVHTQVFQLFMKNLPGDHQLNPKFQMQSEHLHAFISVERTDLQSAHAKHEHRLEQLINVHGSFSCLKQISGSRRQAKIKTWTYSGAFANQAVCVRGTFILWRKSAKYHFFPPNKQNGPTCLANSTCRHIVFGAT